MGCGRPFICASSQGSVASELPISALAAMIRCGRLHPLHKIDAVNGEVTVENLAPRARVTAVAPPRPRGKN
jgi:hypothetical protein